MNEQRSPFQSSAVMVPTIPGGSDVLLAIDAILLSHKWLYVNLSRYCSFVALCMTYFVFGQDISSGTTILLFCSLLLGREFAFVFTGYKHISS